MKSLEPGKTYIIRWDDDPAEYVVKFVCLDRGFFVFVCEDGIKLVARPTAITVREIT